jgi:hypothetical protein
MVADVNSDTKSIRVGEKPYFGFKPKDCEKRSIPISDELIAQLIALKNASSLIFPNDSGRPHGKLLLRLKRVAFSSGLNRGKSTAAFNPTAAPPNAIPTFRSMCCGSDGRRKTLAIRFRSAMMRQS